jgi:hypothetical protein
MSTHPPCSVCEGCAAGAPFVGGEACHADGYESCRAVDVWALAGVTPWRDVPREGGEA